MKFTDPFSTDCASYPLHEIAAVQPHGYLLVINHLNHCVACSRNLLDDFALDTKQVLRVPLTDLLERMHFQAQTALTYDRALTGRAGFVLQQPHARFQGERYLAGEFLILEFQKCGQEGFPEPHAGALPELDLVPYVASLQACETEADSVEILLDLLAQQIGFERCMLYQFLPSGQGEVTAERCQAGVTSYLHHRFPAEDIPPNARRLYVQNPVRLIPDVQAAPVDILAVPEIALIDLTQSRLRAVHPVHLTYLQNMEVRASFSLSVVVDGKLWGLLACHHRQARNLSPAGIRRLEECLAITSLHVQGLRRRRIARVTEQAKNALANLHQLVNVYASAELSAAIARNLAPIMHDLYVDGCVIQSEQTHFAIGECPDPASLQSLNAWCDTRSDADVYQDHLPAELHDQDELRRLACGCIRLNVAEGGKVLFLRKEQREKVLWAGPPARVDGDSGHLTPRSSFASWVEETAFSSRPWFPHELAAVEVLRHELERWFHSRHFSQLARSDALTGLANRCGFKHFIEEAMADSQGTLVLYFFDLDDFKPINDTHGHLIGDQLLCVMAERLQHSLRKREFLARLGGDEFVLVQKGPIPQAAVERTRRQIQNKISAPVTLGELSLQVGVSIGIARYPEDATELNALLEHADGNMYQDKQLHKRQSSRQ